MKRKSMKGGKGPSKSTESPGRKFWSGPSHADRAVMNKGEVINKIPPAIWQDQKIPKSLSD